MTEFSSEVQNFRQVYMKSIFSELSILLKLPPKLISPIRGSGLFIVKKMFSV